MLIILKECSHIQMPFFYPSLDKYIYQYSNEPVDERGPFRQALTEEEITLLPGAEGIY